MANQRIYQFVQNGGGFLGICAGGYFGCREVEFEKGDFLEICEARELGFYPGKAIGPAYGNGVFDYQSNRGARDTEIQWERGLCKIYFNGGCYFDKTEDHPNVQVIAHYNDLPNNLAAVVHCKVGKGRAILSGVHPEYKIGSLGLVK